MKKECDIVKDLLPSYIENLESNSSKEFIEEHIANCQECKNILNSIQNDKIEESKESSIEKDIEINNIKRYRKRNALVKVIILLLVVVIIAFVGILSRYVYTTNIILRANDAVQELKTSNNIKIIVEQHEIAYNTKEDVKDIIIKTEYLYKDGRYKKELSSNQSEQDTQIFYGELNSNEYEYIDKTNQIIKDNFNYPMTDISFFNMFLDIEYDSQQRSIISSFTNMMSFNIRSEQYNNKECYVLRKSSDSSYREIWIDKETMIKVRSIEEIFGNYYYENIYTVELDSVHDEDVTISNINN